MSNDDLAPWEDSYESTWEADRNAKIDLCREVLIAQLVRAIDATSKARKAVNRLTDDVGLYDVEYAEGSAGRDLARHLDLAGFHLRAAQHHNNDLRGH
jgi:hypothetical protein